MYARGWNRVIAYIMAAVQLVFVVALLVIQFTVFRDGHNPEVREVFFGWIVAGTAILMYLSPFKETVNSFSWIFTACYIAMLNDGNSNLKLLFVCGQSVAAWTRNVESLTLLLSLAYQ